MTTSRTRRITRRAVMTLAVVVLPPVWYIGAWLAVSLAAREFTCSSETTYYYLRPAFEPLMWYCATDLPGSTSLNDAWWFVVEPQNHFTSGVPPVRYLTPHER